MSEAQPAMVRLEDYRPYPFAIPEVDLRIELDPASTRVTARMTVRRRTPGGREPLVLAGRELALEAVRLDGVDLPPDRYSLTDEHLTLEGTADTFEVETVTVIRPDANTAKKGLFFHAGFLVTHCEPEGFRKITFSPDRPDVLSVYTVTLEADRDRFPILLSNGRCVASGGEGGRHWRRFHDPFPKPTYIFAAMAGDFTVVRRPFVTASGREVALEIYIGEAEARSCAFALDSLTEALRWEEEVFGLEYDLDAYQIVAIPALAVAQENKGLNLFGVDGIVADPATTTDEEFELIRRIVGHEAFHNWTGNRVTCRDWFQLSLKEGLTRLRDQLFTEDWLDPGVYRIEQVKALRRNQFPEDDGPAAHPVQPTAFVKIDNFYTNTIYEKGAEVLRMLRTLVGPGRFVDVIRAYLDRFDGQAVTLEDLFGVVEDVTGRDLGRFRLWARQAGRPRLSVSRAYDPSARRLSLTLSQSGPPGREGFAPLQIPVVVGFLGEDGEPLGGEVLCDLVEPTQTFVFDAMEPPKAVSLLRAFSAPVSVERFQDDDELFHLVLHDPDPFVAWDSLQTLMVAEIRRLAAEWRSGGPAEPSATLVEVVAEAVLGDRRSARLKAQFLGVPDEPVLSEGLATIDLDAHVEGRRRLRGALCRRLAAEFRGLYGDLSGLDPWDLSPETRGRRALRGAVLDILSARGGEAEARLCLDQVLAGPSMTESFEALSILSHLDTPLRAEGFEGFYARHRDQPLLVDKWFKAAALSRAAGALQDIIALSGHPALDLSNTARTLAFFGSFFRQNRIVFHDPSGGGYRFLAERLVAADRLGAGRASYLTPQIDQWRRYDPARRELMKSALESVRDTPGISSALREVVERSLGA